MAALTGQYRDMMDVMGVDRVGVIERAVLGRVDPDRLSVAVATEVEFEMATRIHADPSQAAGQAIHDSPAAVQFLVFQANQAFPDDVFALSVGRKLHAVDGPQFLLAPWVAR